MNNAIRTYRRNPNWTTVSLLTLVMLGFGVIAQAKDFNLAAPIASKTSTLCSHSAANWCNQVTQSGSSTSAFFLIQ